MTLNASHCLRAKFEMFLDGLGRSISLGQHQHVIECRVKRIRMENYGRMDAIEE